MLKLTIILALVALMFSVVYLICEKFCSKKPLLTEEELRAKNEREAYLVYTGDRRRNAHKRY